MGYEGYPTTTYGGELSGGSYGGVVQSSPVTSGEYIPAQRAQ
jgi:hypothetical protein